jgi:hypothetical protein
MMEKRPSRHEFTDCLFSTQHAYIITIVSQKHIEGRIWHVQVHVIYSLSGLHKIKDGALHTTVMDV